MKRITVAASRNYDVLIGSSLITSLGQYALQNIAPCKSVIISDTNVWSLHGNAVKESMLAAGFEVIHFVFPAGEANKTSETYLSILNFLAENEVTRSDLIIALGGGVVGDVAGFVSATYLRGIQYIQVPTTLLAMVDSSVGGKTAIDLPAGKNLVGAFYQPSLVLCDIDTLNTLPYSVFIDGCAEVIKYGILFDRFLFTELAKHGPSFDRVRVIARCVELKRDVVAKDEFETGLRKKLNLGHTVGHGVELQSNFTVSHGQAVAIGMSIVSRAAAANGICKQNTAERVCGILEKFGLPTDTNITADDLFVATLSDKKRSGEYINLILPVEIGNCMIHNVRLSTLKSIIKAGL